MSSKLQKALELVEAACREAGASVLEFRSAKDERDPNYHVIVWNVARMGQPGRTLPEAFARFAASGWGRP